MDRFNPLTRVGNLTSDNSHARPPNDSGQNHHDDSNPYDDRAPLSPHIIPDDLEAQPSAASAAAAATAAIEMAERSTPGTRFLARFRPAIPSFLSTRHHHHHHDPSPRPSSSHYSGGDDDDDGTATTSYMGTDMESSSLSRSSGGVGVQSPKTPDFFHHHHHHHQQRRVPFQIGAQDLPSTRLHLPNLARTWTQGSNGPPTRPATAVARERDHDAPPPATWPAVAAAVVAAPERVAYPGGESARDGGEEEEGGGGGGGGGGERRTEQREHRERRERRRRGHQRGGSGSGNSSGGSRRSERSHRSGRSRSETEGREGSGTARGERRRPPPKHFLFCFPWIQSRRIRSQALQCFVSGLFLALMLAVYLGLSLTKNISSSELTILLVLIILFVTVFFGQSLVRLCMLLVRARRRGQAPFPEMMGPGGYAVPRQPIPVVLARDEEAAGIESEATKVAPPAYGMWRESVRVDPDRLFWARNENAPAQSESDTSSSGAGGSTGSSRTNVPRPPSYSSDDGVSYVVEARPRSIAPRAAAPAPSSSGPLDPGRQVGPWL